MDKAYFLFSLLNKSAALPVILAPVAPSGWPRAIDPPSKITFYSSIFKGWLKTFFIIERMVSSCISFIAIWGIRFKSPIFGYVAMASGILMYLSFYVIIAVLLIESIPQNARE